MRLMQRALMGLLVTVAVAVAGCGVSSDTYETCGTSADCFRAADTCRPILTDRMCTRTCSVGAECPSSRDGNPFGVCLGDNLCYSSCSFDSHCPIGWSCQSSVRGNICLPR